MCFLVAVMPVRSLLPSIPMADTSLSEPYSPLTPSILRLRYCCLDSTCHFSRELLPGPRRHIREERAKSLRHRRVRENSIAKLRIWQVSQHRRLHHGHDLTGFGAYHRKAENAVVSRTDESL